jgi:hypothetical protein
MAAEHVSEELPCESEEAFTGEVVPTRIPVTLENRLKNNNLGHLYLPYGTDRGYQYLDIIEG